MVVGVRPITDHGSQTGLLDDDHPQYFRADGSRVLTGALKTSGKGIRPVANSTTAIQIQQADGTAFGNWDTTNKRLRIGDGNDPRGPLDIKTDATNSIFLGETTNNANKFGYIVVSQYANTDEPEGVLIFGSYLSSSANQIMYGGGASARNAATKLIFYTAANATTREGTARLNISSSGNVSIGDDATLATARVYIKGSGATSSTTCLRVANSNGDKIMECRDDLAIGLLTSTITKDISIGGNSARTIWLERHTTDATAGNNLTVQAGGCKLAQTNIAGGAYILSDGIGTGNASGGGVLIKNYIAGTTGTADNSQVTVFQAKNNMIAWFAGTPVAQQPFIADADGSLADLTTKYNLLKSYFVNYRLLAAS